jgi:hypothetical protein
MPAGFGRSRQGRLAALLAIAGLTLLLALAGEAFARRLADPAASHTLRFLGWPGAVALILPLLAAWSAQRGGSGVPGAGAGGERCGEPGSGAFRGGGPGPLELDLGLLLLTLAGLVAVAGLERGPGFERGVQLVFAAGLAARMAVLLAGLGRRVAAVGLGGPELRRAGVLIFVLYAGLGLWDGNAARSYGDEPHYLMMAHSLVRDGDLNQWNNYRQGDYADFFRGALQPKPSDRVADRAIYTQGLGVIFPFLLAVPYGLGGYPGTVLALALVAAFTAWRALRLYSGRVDRAESALFAWLAVSLSVPMLIYSTRVYPDMLAALLVLVAVGNLERLPGATAGERWRALGWIACCSLGMLLLKARYLPIVAAVLILAGWRLRSRRGALAALGLASAAGLGGFLLLDYFVLGGDLFFLRFGSLGKLSEFAPGRDILGHLLGLGLDQEAGLLLLAPVYLLAFGGLPERREARGEQRQRASSRLGAGALALLTAPYVVALTGHWTWHSLPTPPCRYLLPVAPLLGIAVARGHERWRARFGRGLPRMLLLLSAGYAFLIWLEPSWRHNFADGSNALVEAVGRAVHEPLTSLLPSYTRPGAASLAWSGLALATLALMLRQRRRGPRALAANPCLAMGALVLGMLLIGALPQLGALAWLPRVQQPEDTETVVHAGGRSYPFPVDPFYHRTSDYGWELWPGARLEMAWRLPRGPGVLELKVRGVAGGPPGRLVVRLDDTAPEVELGLHTAGWQRLVAPGRAPGGRVHTSVRLGGEEHVILELIRWWPAAPLPAGMTLRLARTLNRLGLNGERLLLDALLWAGPGTRRLAPWEGYWREQLERLGRQGTPERWVELWRAWGEEAPSPGELLGDADPELRLTVAAMLLDAGEANAAEPLLKGLLESEKERPLATLLLARLERQRGRLQRARKRLRQAALLLGNRPEVREERRALVEAAAGATRPHAAQTLQFVRRDSPPDEE